MIRRMFALFYEHSFAYFEPHDQIVCNSKRLGKRESVAFWFPSGNFFVRNLSGKARGPDRATREKHGGAYGLEACATR